MPGFAVGKPTRFTLRESVVERLRAAIAEGDIAPGTRLVEVEPSESQRCSPPCSAQHQRCDPSDDDGCGEDPARASSGKLRLRSLQPPAPRCTAAEPPSTRAARRPEPPCSPDASCSADRTQAKALHAAVDRHFRSSG